MTTFYDEWLATSKKAEHAVENAPALAKGVKMVKVRTGPEWRSDLDTLAELQRLLPRDVELMVDGSETYTLATALKIAHRLHDLGVLWFEEPLPQNARAGIEELARKSPVAIAYYPLPREQVLTDNAIPARLILDQQPDVAYPLAPCQARRAEHRPQLAQVRCDPPRPRGRLG